MIFIDYAVSDDCINISSYGEICVKCGCCSRNQNYRDRLVRRIRYYKQCLEEEYAFDRWADDDWLKAIQERNAKADIVYYKRKIRLYKKLLRTTKGGVVDADD